MLQEYPPSFSAVGDVLSDPQVVLWRRKARIAIEQLEPDSSPGFPLCRLARTNTELLELLGAEALVDFVVARLQAISAAPLTTFKEVGAAELVEMGLVDPVRLFVKNELHSKAKVDQGRMRLIMSISVIDQLVERVLNFGLNSAEIQRWDVIPSKPGMGLDDDGLDKLRRNIEAIPQPTSTDVSGFDWSVPQWLIDLDAQARAELSGAHSQDNMWWRRGRLLGLSLLVLSDGTVVEQTIRGVQKSGSYITSSGNSRMRVMLGWLVALSYHARGLVMAMGDDAVEDTSWLMPSSELGTITAELTAAYHQFGFKLKELSVAGRDAEGRVLGHVEFCAYLFTFVGDMVTQTPVRWVKMFANFLYRGGAKHQGAERWLMLQHELRRTNFGLAKVDEMFSWVYNKSPGPYFAG